MLNLKLKTMNSINNRVTLIGNLGQDPETKTTESGKRVVHFTLATQDGYKNSEGQKVNETTWHNITAWNGLADVAGKYLKKGNQVAVEGRIVYKTYEDKKGVTKYTSEIVLSDLFLLRSGKDHGKDDMKSEE
jgi:single-strand DNA-binding protein